MNSSVTDEERKKHSRVNIMVNIRGVKVERKMQMETIRKRRRNIGTNINKRK
jgi:hypothetical protein